MVQGRVGVIGGCYDVEMRCSEAEQGVGKELVLLAQWSAWNEEENA